MANFQRDYYSTDQQIEAIKLKWFDEGPVVRLLQKNPTNSIGINTKKFDAFRQGVEIRQEKYAFQNIVKITPGTPGHLVNPVCLDRKSTRLNSSHVSESRMPSSA